MRVAWMIALFATLSVRHGIAQSTSVNLPFDAACIELNQRVVTQAKDGQIAEAEEAVRAALAGGLDRSADRCAGLVLNNLAMLVSLSGRLAEGERLAGRSVAILEKLYPPDDPVLLRPLQILAANRLELEKRAKARETLKRLQSIRVEQPEDSALLHGTSATLFRIEDRLPEAEIEYLAALAAWEKAGRGDGVDAACVLTALGALYIEEGRFHEARQALDRALAIYSHALYVVPMDRVRVLFVRGVLRARQSEWREAEQDLHDAVATVDRELRVDTVLLQRLLNSYAVALLKNHRRREARAIEARVAAFGKPTDGVVDVTELLAKGKPVRK